MRIPSFFRGGTSRWSGGRRVPEPPVCVLHIMKTAGTSLRAILEDDIGSGSVYPNARDLARREHGWYPSAQEVLAALPTTRRHQILIGHFPAAILDHLPAGYRGAVVLRDPVQRTLSALAHVARIRGSMPARLVEDEQVIGRLVRDYQTKILGCDGIDQPNHHDRVDDATLDRALRRVDDLAFVGITERFRDSCRLFDHLFGTTTQRFDRQENVLRSRGTEHAELVPLILPHIRRDMVLYEHATRRFADDVARLGLERPVLHEMRRGA